MENRDLPLRCKVIDNKLVIEIGIDTLAYCFQEHPLFWDGDKDESIIKVADPHILACDVVKELNSEREDGSTLITDALDEAMLHAYENGSQGFE